MINYYRILQLDDYSDISVVKRQYRKLAKEYHPDVNRDNPEAEDIIKIINTAHTTLTNPREKSRYDQLLKNAYLIEQYQTSRTFDTDLEARKERVKEYIRQRLKAEIREFETSLKKFPAVYRYGLGILSALTGLQVVYSHWYINLTNQNYSLIVLGYLLYLVSCAFVFQFYDRHLWYRSQLSRKPRKMSWINPVYLFLTILFMGPLLTWSLNEYRKTYHLSHYAKIAVGKVLFLSEGNRVQYEFHDEKGLRVVKSQLVTRGFDQLQEEELIYVTYSSYDPRIARILKIEQ